MHSFTVAHLTSVHPPFDTRIFHKECRSLAAAGYSVKLVAAHERQEVVGDVEIIPIAKPGRRLQRMTKTVAEVLRIASRLNADIYHFHDPELIPAGLLLVQKGHRVIYDSHEDAPRALLSGGRDYLPNQVKRPASWLLEQLENVAARRFSAVVAATPAIARRFAGLNPHLVTINNFPILDELVPSMGTDWGKRKQAVAYVGAISPVRGLRQMIEATGLLAAKREARLKLAGRFDSAQDRTDVMNLTGWQNTDELGSLDRPAVAALLASVQGGLVIFDPLPNHVEAQPNKLFEYMSAGIPVIASDFPLWRELIARENCGLLVNPLDSTALADAIEYILTHPDGAEAMGHNGREAVRNSYNWAIEEQKLLTLYAKLLSAPASPTS
jgi:glycosyltransferase involved in cell wall biosynthesis